MKRLAPALSIALVMVCLGAGPALAAPTLDGKFDVPGIETNNKIVAGPDGNMWVTVRDGVNDVARITPAGEVTAFALTGVEGALGIAVDPTGKMWVTYQNGVASFEVGDPAGSSKATPIGGANGFNSIVAGPDGEMWVAANEKVVHFPPADPTKTTPITVEKLLPRDIDVSGPLILVADQGEASRVVTLTTAGVEQDLPIPGGSQGLAANAAGQIAFSAPGATPEQAGLITPPAPAQSFELLGDPFGVALGADQAFWIVQFAAGGLTRLTTAGEHTFLGGLPVNSARQIAAGPGNTLWVTLEKNEGVTEAGVARVSGLEPPSEAGAGGGGASPPVPQTKIVKGPKKTVRTTAAKARVRFRFTSSVAGSRFECALVRARTGKKVPKAKRWPKPVFRSCKAPRSYGLRPGRYRFKVRAVASGQVDPTPASRAFRVLHVAKHKPRPQR